MSIFLAVLLVFSAIWAPTSMFLMKSWLLRPNETAA